MKTFVEWINENESLRPFSWGQVKQELLTKLQDAKDMGLRKEHVLTLVETIFG